jgi:hypothetical protein
LLICCRGIREPGYRYGDDDDVGSLEWHASLRRFDRARASSGPHRATSRFIPLKTNRSASNVQSCKVSAQNGDAWNAIQSIIGGETSSPIKTATTYTLTCIDLQGATQTKTATVQILPTFQEQ